MRARARAHGRWPWPWFQWRHVASLPAVIRAQWCQYAALARIEEARACAEVWRTSAAVTTDRALAGTSPDLPVAGLRACASLEAGTPRGLGCRAMAISR